MRVLEELQAGRLNRWRPAPHLLPRPAQPQSSSPPDARQTQPDGLRRRRLQRAALRHVRGAELDRPGGVRAARASTTPASGCSAPASSSAICSLLATNARFQRTGRRPRRSRRRAASGTRASSARPDALDQADRERYDGARRALPLDHRPADARRRRRAAGHRGAGRQPRPPVVDVPAPARRAPHDPHVLGDGGRRVDRRKRRRRAAAQARDESIDADLRRSLEGQIDILGQRIDAAGRGAAQAGVHRRGAGAHRGAGRVDPRAGGALDRSRAALAAHRRDCRDARRHRPVDPRPAAGVRRHGGSADASRRRSRPTRAPRRVNDASCPRWATKCATCSARGRRRSFCSTATSSTSCRPADGCCRCPRFSTR